MLCIRTCMEATKVPTVLDDLEPIFKIVSPAGEGTCYGSNLLSVPDFRQLSHSLRRNSPMHRLHLLRPFFLAVCQAPAKAHLSRDFPPKKSGIFAPERKQHLLPYMEEGARPNPPPRAAAAAKSARGKSKSIPPSLPPHSYSTLLPPFPLRPWHSLPKWAASSVVEGGRGKGIGGPARGRRGGWENSPA